MKIATQRKYQRHMFVVPPPSEEERCRRLANQWAKKLRDDKMSQSDRGNLALWLDALANYPKILLAIGRSKYGGGERATRARAIAYHAVIRKCLGDQFYKDSVANYWGVELKTVIDALTNHRREAEDSRDYWIEAGKIGDYSEIQVLNGEESIEIKKLKARLDKERQIAKVLRQKKNT